MKRKIINYSAAAGIGVLLFFLVAFIQKLFWQSSQEEIFKILCDCFTVPGLVLVFVGLLVVCSNGGTFDMLGFGVKKFFGLFKKESDKQTFYEYRQNKLANRRSFWYLLVVGGVFVAAAVIFLILYHNV